MKAKKVHVKKVMPRKMRHPHVGSTMGRKKGTPKGTKAYTHTEK